MTDLEPRRIRLDDLDRPELAPPPPRVPASPRERVLWFALALGGLALAIQRWGAAGQTTQGFCGPAPRADLELIAGQGLCALVAAICFAAAPWNRPRSRAPAAPAGAALAVLALMPFLLPDLMAFDTGSC